MTEFTAKSATPALRGRFAENARIKRAFLRDHRPGCSKTPAPMLAIH